MANSRSASQYHSTTLGDAAVDGLLAGAGAGVIMVLFMVILSLASGAGALAVLIALDPAGASPVIGAVTHLAVAGMYGLLFAVLSRWFGRLWQRLPLWAAGMVFGLVLWLLAAMTLTVRPAAAVGTVGWLEAIPAASFAAAHLVYGLTLGLLLKRVQNRAHN